MNPPTKHCLLIVDDEPDVCDSVHDLLRREFRVLKANSAQEGFRLMQEEEVHIIMTDQRMPQITGVELLAKVKSRNPRRSGCSSPASPTWSRSSPRSTRATSSGSSRSPGSPRSSRPPSARRRRVRPPDRGDGEENDRLREQIRELRERVALLEQEMKKREG